MERGGYKTRGGRGVPASYGRGASRGGRGNGYQRPWGPSNEQEGSQAGVPGAAFVSSQHRPQSDLSSRLINDTNSNFNRSAGDIPLPGTAEHQYQPSLVTTTSKSSLPSCISDTFSTTQSVFDSAAFLSLMDARWRAVAEQQESSGPPASPATDKSWNGKVYPVVRPGCISDGRSFSGELDRQAIASGIRHV